MKEEGSITLPNKQVAGLYVHIPFCSKKCGFCDFYSMQRSSFPFAEYMKALTVELQLYEKKGLFDTYIFDTLYFGGGTPSLVPLEYWKEFFDFLEKKNWSAHFKEITLEMNPEDVTLSTLSFYKNRGVNRISLGIESLDASVLQILGRKATLEDNLKSIEYVRHSFPHYSLDLMYGIRGQNIDEELTHYMQFSPPHLSAYALTLYPQTPFYYKNQESVVSEDIFLQQFKKIHEKFSSLGYNHYEISNFAKNGEESEHNKHYWRGDAYLGIGSKACGFLENTRYTNAQLKPYLSQVKQGNYPRELEESLDEKDYLLEGFLLKLRTKDSIALKEILKRLKSEEYILFRECLNKLAGKEFFLYDKESETVMPTLKSWLFSDFIAKEIYNILYP